MPPLTLLAWFLAGASFGAVYFGALWLSVTRLTAGGSTGGFVLAGLLRLSLALAVLALVLALAPNVLGLLDAGIGFIAARIVATRRAKPQGSEG